MNEEEIIERLSERIQDSEDVDRIQVFLTNDITAIQGLLDLYKKEKEKNKELSAKLTEKICKGAEEYILEEYRQQIKELKEENGKLKVELDELEKTLKQTQDSWFEDTQKIEQLKLNGKEKNTGKLVKNKIDGTIGIVLREWETGQIQVLEKIQPKVINTHDSWDTLELLEEK